MSRIGFYVHHHGSGHAMRASALGAALARRGHEPVTLGSRAGADVALPLDPPGRPGADPTAGGALHWAPTGSGGLARRMAAISAFLATGPAAFHVDVSVEVALLARLHGIPLTVQAMPGDRCDRPHVLGHSIADALIAAWPDWVPLPAHLEPVADRVHAVGGVTRFAGRRPDSTGHGFTGAGAGGEFRILDRAHGWVEDPWPDLCAADVVVCAAGQNSVADVAAAGRRAIVLPLPRPYGEQDATARVLSDAGLALVPMMAGAEPPEPDCWPGLLDRAPAADWSAWGTDGAADRAADVIGEVARG